MNLIASVEADLPCKIVPVRREDDGAWAYWTLHVIVPPIALDKVIRIAARASGAVVDDILIRAEAITGGTRQLKTLFGSSEITSSDKGTRLRGWILADRPISCPARLIRWTNVVYRSSCHAAQRHRGKKPELSQQRMWIYRRTRSRH